MKVSVIKLYRDTLYINDNKTNIIRYCFLLYLNNYLLLN